MRELSTEENKQHLLGILKEVARFCDENGLRYYLAYGTLIGAVRHKGFIPWDDDIDIQMPRPDYETFIKTYTDEIFKVVVPLDEMSRHSYAKVIDTRTIKSEKGIKYEKGKELGIDIDVFPIDGQPENEEDFVKYYKKKQCLLRTFLYKFCDIKQLKPKVIIAYIIPIISSKFITAKKIMKKLKKINENYDYEDCRYVGATDSLFNSINNRNPKEWYDSAVSLKFEDCEFKAPVGYDSILKKMYGEYMTLPPKDKQVTHHDNKVYLKD